MEKIPEEELIEASVDQPVPVIFEQIAEAGPIEELLETTGSGTGAEGVSGNHETRPDKTEFQEFQAQEREQGEEELVGNIHESDEKNDALPQDDAPDDGAGDTESDGIVGSVVPESVMTEEKDSFKGSIAPSDDNQQKTLLMSPVNGTSGHTLHTVSRGDTLWEISERYTGSGFNYPDVAKKNKIANPDLIYPDQQVTLPVKE